jgi:hypothetical protein
MPEFEATAARSKDSDMIIYGIRLARRAITTIILTAVLFTQSVWSWGRIGHRVAAEMAEARLSPHALVAVHDLLGPGVSPADISNWADEQRDIPGSGPWHYVNVPITEDPGGS